MVRSTILVQHFAPPLRVPLVYHVEAPYSIILQIFVHQMEEFGERAGTHHQVFCVDFIFRSQNARRVRDLLKHGQLDPDTWTKFWEFSNVMLF